MIENNTNPESPSNSANFHELIVALIVFFFFLGSMLHTLHEHKGNYSGFLRISQEMAFKNPLLKGHTELLKELTLVKDSGYDGSLYYFMSFDPFLTKLSNAREYESVVDAPVFRYRRILFVWLTYFLSFGNPNNFPMTMVYLLLFAHFIGSFLLAKTAKFIGKSPYYGLLWILIPAFSVSLRYATPEPIAALFLVAAYYAYLKEKFLLSTAIFAFGSSHEKLLCFFF